MRYVQVFYLCIMFVFFAGGRPVSSGESADPEEILQKLGRQLEDIKTVKTQFVQKKELSMFDRTMIICGEIAVRKPDRMAWRVEDPVKYTMVITGSRLVQWDEDTNRIQKVKLDKHPTFKAMFEQLTVWFSGNYASLSEKYHVDVEQKNPFIFTFVPREGTMLENVIERVRIVFREDARYIQKLAIDEGGGDRTVIEFCNTRLDVPLEESNWEVQPR